jgi:hypothetical protein
MGINTTINTDAKTITRRVSGKLSVADIKTAMQDIQHHPEFKKGMHAIWDLSQADVRDISSHDIKDLIREIQKAIDLRGSDFKIAIIAPEDLSYGLSKVFEGYGMELPIFIRVMRSHDEANAWINTQDE